MCTRDGFNSRGFTVLQFLVALVMLVVASGFAVPTVSHFAAKSHLVLTSNSIVARLKSPGAAAGIAGDDVSICPSSDGAECEEGSWDNGWIIFSDANGDGQAVAGEVIRVVKIEGEMANSGFGDNMAFQTGAGTVIDSDETAALCHEQDTIGENCANVAVNRLGLNEPAAYQATSESTPLVDEPTS